MDYTYWYLIIIYWKLKLKEFKCLYEFFKNSSDKHNNSTFYEKTLYFPEKISRKNGIVSHFLKLSLASGFLEIDRWILSASAFSLLWCHTLGNLRTPCLHTCGKIVWCPRPLKGSHNTLWGPPVPGPGYRQCSRRYQSPSLWMWHFFP